MNDIKLQTAQKQVAKATKTLRNIFKKNELSTEIAQKIGADEMTPEQIRADATRRIRMAAEYLQHVAATLND